MSADPEDWYEEGERVGMTGSITTLENDDDIEVPARMFPFGFQTGETVLPPPAVRTSNRHHDTGRR